MARHVAIERDRRCGGARMTTTPPDRARWGAADRCAPVDQPGDDPARGSRDRPAGDDRCGCSGDRPVARTGARGGARDRGVHARGLGVALHDALSLGLLHDDRGPAAPGIDRRQPPGDRGGGNAGGRGGGWLHPGARPRRRWPSGGLARPRRSAGACSGRDRRVGSGCRGRWGDPGDRAAASDVRLGPVRRLDARPGAGYRRRLRFGGRRRHGRHVPHLVGPRGFRVDRARRARGQDRDVSGVRLENAVGRRCAAEPPLPR